MDPPESTSWEQEKKRARVKQFMNILEQLPRLCSPTICGTLSQPTTRNERSSRGADKFEWSLEQKAILSPANITTDTDATDDWQNVAELNQSWLQQESDVFFSQKTIAPSPMVTPSTRAIRRAVPTRFQETMFDEHDEDEEEEEEEEVFDRNLDDLDVDEEEDDDENTDIDMEDESFDVRRDLLTSSDDDDDDDDDVKNTTSSTLNRRKIKSDDEDTDINDDNDLDRPEDRDMDSLFFSPQPLKSSQTQQRMDIFSPETFVRVMEDEHTLQSTPKTIGGVRSQLTRTRTRTRTVTEMSD